MRKKLILLNPESGGFLRDSLHSLLMPEYPPALTILEAMTPKGYEIIRLHQPKSIEYGPALVAITTMTVNIHVAYAHADRFRKAGAKVIMGGPHVNFQVEEALEHCDAVCVGEAETVWADILRDYEKGRLRKVYDGKPAQNFWEYYHKGLLKLKPWQIEGAILATRGCRFHCSFCVISAAMPNLRVIPVPKVIELIKASGAKSIGFHDPNLYSVPSYAKNLFKAMIPLKIEWRALVTVDVARDPEALELARKSGCKSLFIGFETLNTEAAEANPGKLRWGVEYHTLIKRIQKKGIVIKGSFIVGYDQDDWESLKKLLLFGLTCGVNWPDVCVLTPFPGTALHKQLESEGRITTKDWKKYDLNYVVFKPKKISADGLAIWVRFHAICFFFANPLMFIIVMMILMIRLFG